MRFYSPTASLCFNRPTKRIDWPCKKPDSAILSLSPMVKVNDNGLDDEVRYSKQRNGELSCPELQSCTNDSEAILSFLEKGLVSEGRITEGDDISQNWGYQQLCGYK